MLKCIFKNIRNKIIVLKNLYYLFVFFLFILY